MDFLPPEYLPALPEMTLALVICVLLLADLYVPDRLRELSYILALAGLVLTAVAVGESAMPGRVEIFSGSYVADPLARFLKLFTLVMVATAFLYSRDYLRERGLFKGEYYLLGLFGTLGIFVMISAAGLLTMYLGLEMLALSLYGLVAFDRNSPVAAEAAMKYFVLGAIASGCLLYGISIVYGVSGSLRFSEVAAGLAGGESDLGVLAGMALIIVGIAFKFGAVPFHMWLPDVYEGAPTPVTLFVGTVPKLAAFVLLLRMLVEGLGSLAEAWQPILATLAVVSLALGNVAAIAQSNIKRMLGYSTIAHVGFIFLGFAAGSRDGMEAALFYTVVYVLMAAGAFGILILASRAGFEVERIDDLKGLNQRSAWFAAMMLLLMVSLIGIPPLAGFYAKWWVLAALVDAGMIGLAIAAVVFSVIGAFYYLRVVKVMYFDSGGTTLELTPSLDLRLVLSINALAVLALGLSPDFLIELCAAALG